MATWRWRDCNHKRFFVGFSIALSKVMERTSWQKH
jgi:hypothetical protein